MARSRCPPGARARLVKAGEDARIRVSILPPNAAIADELGKSELVELVGKQDTSELQVMQRTDGSWALLDDVFGFGNSPHEPWLVRVSAAEVRAIRELVEHYYWYSLPIRFAKQCQDLPQALRVSLHDASEAKQLTTADAQELHRFPELANHESGCYVLEVEPDGEAKTPVCIGVRNGSSSTIFVTLLGCQTSGLVELLAEKQPIPAGGAHVFWVQETQKEPFYATQPRGHSTCIDRIVAIGTTNRDARLGALAQAKSFEEILHASRGGATKNLGPKKHGPPAELWTSDIVTLRLVAPAP